ncbi:MAG: hypothetical protein Q9191_004843 [Dirinaria sp. TL-2023a]
MKNRDRLGCCVICNCRNKEGGEGQAYSKFGSNFSIFGRSSNNEVFGVTYVSTYTYQDYSVTSSGFTTLSACTGRRAGDLETISRSDYPAEPGWRFNSGQPGGLECRRTFVVHQCCLVILEHWIDWRRQYNVHLENIFMSIEAFYDAVDQQADLFQGASNQHYELILWRNDTGLLGFAWDLSKVMWWDPVLSHWDSDEALHWDWKRLGRALSEDEALGENADQARATQGLRTRRSIWRCIANVERTYFRELRKAELRRIAPTKPRRGALRSFA